MFEIKVLMFSHFISSFYVSWRRIFSSLVFLSLFKSEVVLNVPVKCLKTCTLICNIYFDMKLYYKHKFQTVV